MHMKHDLFDAPDKRQIEHGADPAHPVCPQTRRLSKGFFARDMIDTNAVEIREQLLSRDQAHAAGTQHSTTKLLGQIS